MADQEAMTRGPDVKIHAPFTEGVIGNVAEFGNDTLELVELQASLASKDLNECLSRAILPVVLAVLGVLLVVGLVPVALAGIALLLVGALGVSTGAALLITAGGALLLAALLGGIAVWGIRRSFESFDRSREEFARNFAWIKTVLSNASRMRPASKGRGRGSWSYPA